MQEKKTQACTCKSPLKFEFKFEMDNNFVVDRRHHTGDLSLSLSLSLSLFPLSPTFLGVLFILPYLSQNKHTNKKELCSRES